MSLTRNVDPRPRRPGRGGEVGQAVEAGQRAALVEWTVVVVEGAVVAEHLQRGAQFAACAVAGVGDVVQGLGHGGPVEAAVVLGRHMRGHRGPHADEGDAVREQVVQVAGDAQAFLGDLYAKAKALAAADDRSLNSWLVSLVRRAAEDNERRSTPGT